MERYIWGVRGGESVCETNQERDRDDPQESAGMRNGVRFL